jgi:hypothetical protein
VVTTDENSLLPDSMADDKKKSVKRRITYLIGAIILLLGVTALAVAFFVGRGPQPEDVLPKDTVAIAKIDLNPKIAQRIDLVRFLSKFPNAVQDFDEEDPVGSILKQSSLTSGIDWKSIKPWIGNRYAVAVVESAQTLNGVILLSVNDVAEMKYFMAKNYPNASYRLIKEFLVIAESKSILDLIESSPTQLSSNEIYKKDMDSIGGDQIAFIWADLNPLAKFAESFIYDFLYQQGLDPALYSTDSTNGRVAIGMRFTPDSFVTNLVTFGLGTQNSKSETPPQAKEILSQLPVSTLGAVAVEGIGRAISDTLASNSAADETLRSIGISTADIAALLEGPAAFLALEDTSSTSDPLYVLRLTPRDTSFTVSTLRNVLSRNGLDPSELDSILIADDKYLYLGVDRNTIQRAINSAKSNATKLGDSEKFKKSLTESGSFAAFVDLERILPLLEVNTNGAPLGGLGVSIGEDSKDPSVFRTSIVLSLKP